MGQELGTGRRIGRLFEISSLRLPTTSVSAATSSSPSLSLWHSRLEHKSSSRVQQLVSRGLLGPMSKENFDCVSCQLGKQPTLPFHNSESMSTGIFDLIHSDVWGPSPINSIGGSRYFVVRFPVFVFLLLVSLLLPHLHLPYHFGILGSSMHHFPGYNS
jgi:hypothetical protein